MNLTFLTQSFHTIKRCEVMLGERSQNLSLELFLLQDNQLRSRVFAERLGLEADWNCHISLADPPSEVSGTPSQGTFSGHLTSASSRTSSTGTGLLRRPNASLGHGGWLPVFPAFDANFDHQVVYCAWVHIFILYV